MAATPKKKHVRSNNEARARAKNLVLVWYRDLHDSGHSRYQAVNGISVVTSHEFNKQSNPQPAYGWKLPGLITASPDLPNPAHGSETPSKPAGGDWPGGVSSIGFTGHHPRPDQTEKWGLYFIRRCMRHVGLVCFESRLALEMSAAGFNEDAMCEELQCGRDVARGYVNEGIAIICSCLLLKPWRIEEIIREDEEHLT